MNPLKLLPFLMTSAASIDYHRAGGRKAKPKHKVTPADTARLEAAQAKRDRRAAKRRQEQK